MGTSFESHADGSAERLRELAAEFDEFFSGLEFKAALHSGHYDVFHRCNDLSEPVREAVSITLQRKGKWQLPCRPEECPYCVPEIGKPRLKPQYELRTEDIPLDEDQTDELADLHDQFAAVRRRLVDVSNWANETAEDGPGLSLVFKPKLWSPYRKLSALQQTIHLQWNALRRAEEEMSLAFYSAAAGVARGFDRVKIAKKLDELGRDVGELERWMREIAAEICALR